MKVAFGPFTFDAATRELVKAGKRVHLSPKAFDVLQVLLERRPAVVTKGELHDRVWSGAFVVEANLSVAIAEIRQALGDSRDGRYVRTAHRVGYAFSGEATDVGADRGLPFSRCWLRWNDRSFQLAPGENVLGRDPRSAVWIDASGVSRRHAVVRIAGGRTTIEDLGSRNGTFVAGVPVRGEHALSDGDQIELGSATVLFRVWSDEAQPATERINRG
jgi:DNA-binding winged helix-turn-helix (wHTH) protein